MNVSGAINLCCFCFLLGRDLENCLRTGYLHRRERWASFLYCEQLDALFDHYLARLSRQVHTFSLLRTVDDYFHAAGAQRVFVIPSFVLLAHPVSSPYLDANEEIVLQAIGSLGC